jgi:glyoxylase-like metal-dependent hydrolase (beta-lactamase superfamily II)
VFVPANVFGQNYDTVEITTQHAAGNIFMLQGAGGNIGACVGEDGVFLIDDQFAPLTEKIKAAISKISKREIRFVINTHWHYDHVGGNEKLGDMGAVIVAHDNVRYRLSTEQFVRFFNKKIPPSPKAALPIITFSKDLTFHLNGEEMYVFHRQHAHTDGDAVVYFKHANVVHTGDIYFSGLYPFIDLSSKGSVGGVIEAVRHILSIIDDRTKIIPGHGPMSSRADLFDYLEMLVTMRARMEKHIKAGNTLMDIQAMGPSKEFDPAWGGGFLSPDKFVQILYDDLSKKTD